MKKMPLDLSKFKKVSSDGHYSTLKHADGHELKIAHYSLDKEKREQLQGLPLHESKTYAKGGQIPRNEELARQAETDNEPAIAKEYRSGNYIPYSEKEVAKEVALPLHTKKYYSDGGDVENSYAKYAGAYGGQSPSQQAAQDVAPPPAAAMNTAGDASIDPKVYAPTPDPLAAAPVAPAPIPDMTAGPRAELGMLNKGIEGQKKAGEEAVHATEMRGNVNASNIMSNIKQQQALDAEQANKQIEYDKNNNDMLNAFKNGQIQPKHIFQAHNSLGNITTAIGLILGGIGGGLTHQKNPALEFLNQQIDRDLEAQKFNLGKIPTLLEANMKMQGNQRLAYLTAKNNAKDFLSSMMDVTAQQSGSPIARANADAAIAQLQASKAPEYGEAVQHLKMGEYMKKSAQNPGSGDPAANQISAMQYINPQMAETMRKAYVPGVGIASGMKEIPTDVQKELSERQDFAQSLQKLRAFAHQNSGTLNPEKMNAGSALAADVQTKWKNMNQMKRFSPGMEEITNRVIDLDPTKFFGAYRTDPKYKQAELDNLASLNSLKKSYGLRAPGPITEMPAKRGK